MHNQIGYRPTWAEVCLGDLKHNFLQIKKMTQAKVKIMVTVKADAYGHGLIPVSRCLQECGVDYLGVASIDEGIKLREAKINLPILVLGMVLKKDIDPFFDYDLSATVCTLSFARVLSKKSLKISKPIKAHIKVDTGMGRIGIMHKDALGEIKNICKLKNLKVEGIFTHFTLADVNRDFTILQIRLFADLINELKKEKINIPLVHAANSAGVISYQGGHFNMVRPGLAIYGLYPDENLKIDLKPLLKLKTKVVYSKKVPKGYGISYGYTYVTKESSNIVTLPIGYGDGYPRNLSNLGPVLIKGKRFKIAGRVCMDQIMVDVGKMKVKPGEEAVLIGKQRKNLITTEELARLSGTIPYEIVCGLGSRIPRVYL